LAAKTVSKKFKIVTGDNLQSISVVKQETQLSLTNV